MYCKTTQKICWLNKRAHSGKLWRQFLHFKINKYNGEQFEPPRWHQLHWMDSTVRAFQFIKLGSKLDVWLCSCATSICMKGIAIGQGWLLISWHSANALECRSVTGERIGHVLLILGIKLHYEGNNNGPIYFQRHQFPVILAFYLTINTAQGQSLKKVSSIIPESVFSRYQLYVECSRCTSAHIFYVSVCSNLDSTTPNILYHPIFPQ